MNAMDLLERIEALRREGKPFAVATVVARRKPVSSHLGDRAIVFPDGRMEGFIGGACAHEIIRKQALEAIELRCARLVSIEPDASGPAESSTVRVFATMTCASEGAVDIYIEPFPQMRLLVVAGATPVAGALARLARSMDYDVVRVVTSSEIQGVEPEAKRLGIRVVMLDDFEQFLAESRATGEDLAAVVASQGHYDERALESILKFGAAYVGLLASRKRGATVQALLKEAGVLDVERIHTPAGIDLGARTAPEVALSILAEIVQSQPSGVPHKPAEETPVGLAAAAATTSATDPVCGMQVKIAGAQHTATLNGITFYFCCAGCRARFLKDPAQFRTAAS